MWWPVWFGGVTVGALAVYAGITLRRVGARSVAVFATVVRILVLPFLGLPLWLLALRRNSQAQDSG